MEHHLTFEHLPGISKVIFCLVNRKRIQADIMNIDIQRVEKRRALTREQMKEVLRSEGFSGIHQFSDSPGREYPDHQHDYVEVRWVVEGEVTFGVGDREYQLKPGDRLDMPANTVHSARIHPEKGATYICASK